MLEQLLSGLFVMGVFDNLTQPFEYLANNLLANPLLIGMTIFLFFTLFMLLVFIPFEAMAPIELLICFAVFEYIPQLRIVVAILVGLVIGIGLIKWVRR